jgi:hypothetical protein
MLKKKLMGIKPHGARKALREIGIYDLAWCPLKKTGDV